MWRVSADPNGCVKAYAMCETARNSLLSLIVVLAFLVGGRPSSAQVPQTDPKGDEEQALVEKWYQVYEDVIERISVSHSSPDHDQTQATILPRLDRQTVLTLNDSERGGRHGKVYLRAEKGRPTVLGVIMSVRDNDVPGARVIAYEFNSLTQGTVTASRDDEVFWRCEQPGVQWKAGPTDVEVSANRATRLAQMRHIARQYKAGHYKNDVLAAEFRLMPQPIYRYLEKTPGVVDGAIFSYSIGTDPCIFLLVEARENGWFVACARSHAFTLKVQKGPEVIWSFDDQVNRNVFQTGAWYQKYTAERRVADDPSKVLFSIWQSR